MSTKLRNKAILLDKPVAVYFFMKMISNLYWTLRGYFNEL